MTATAPILVRDKADTGTDWRRFMAILCFLEFYFGFVKHGTAIHEFWTSHEAQDPDAVVDAWSGFLQAVMFLLLGRTLWYRSRLSRLWGPLICLTCVAMMHASRWLTQQAWPGWSWPLGRWIVANNRQILWICMLTAALWLDRLVSRIGMTHPHWVKLAACWCIVWLVLSLARLATYPTLFPVTIN